MKPKHKENLLTWRLKNPLIQRLNVKKAFASLSHSQKSDGQILDSGVSSLIQDSHDTEHSDPSEL